MVLDVLTASQQPILGFATGSTPLGLYRVLIEKSHADEHLLACWKRMIGYNLDEYVGLHPNHPQSYHYYMQENLYRHLPVAPARIHIPSAEGAVEENCHAYHALLTETGWPDLQILGIGTNGHIGFNEPDDELQIYTHLTALTPVTRQANARFFDSVDEVPQHAVTMGIGDILKAKQVVLLAYGEQKREALRQAFSGAVSTRCPASFLQLHAHVTIFTDQDVRG